MAAGDPNCAENRASNSITMPAFCSTARRRRTLARSPIFRQTGARIVLETECELPERFILLLTRSGEARRHCRLVWRNGLAAGVEFPTPHL